MISRTHVILGSLNLVALAVFMGIVHHARLDGGNFPWLPTRSRPLRSSRYASRENHHYYDTITEEPYDVTGDQLVFTDGQRDLTDKDKKTRRRKMKKRRKKSKAESSLAANGTIANISSAEAATEEEVEKPRVIAVPTEEQESTETQDSFPLDEVDTRVPLPSIKEELSKDEGALTRRRRSDPQKEPPLIISTPEAKDFNYGPIDNDDSSTMQSHPDVARALKKKTTKSPDNLSKSGKGTASENSGKGYKDKGGKGLYGFSKSKSSKGSNKKSGKSSGIDSSFSKNKSKGKGFRDFENECVPLDNDPMMSSEHTSKQTHENPRNRLFRFLLDFDGQEGSDEGGNSFDVYKKHKGKKPANKDKNDSNKKYLKNRSKKAKDLDRDGMKNGMMKMGKMRMMKSKNGKKKKKKKDTDKSKRSTAMPVRSAQGASGKNVGSFLTLYLCSDLFLF